MICEYVVCVGGVLELFVDEVVGVFDWVVVLGDVGYEMVVLCVWVDVVLWVEVVVLVGIDMLCLFMFDWLLVLFGGFDCVFVS